MAYKIGVFVNFANSKENTCSGVSFVINLLVENLHFLPEKRPRYWCFPENFAKLLKACFWMEITNFGFIVPNSYNLGLCKTWENILFLITLTNSVSVLLNE